MTKFGLMVAFLICCIGVANTNQDVAGQTQSSSSGFNELASSCLLVTKSDSADTEALKNKAEICEKLSSVLKSKLDAELAILEKSNKALKNSSWQFYSALVLIVFDIVAILILVALSAHLFSAERNIGSKSTPDFLKDYQGKTSFSRVVGMIGSTGLIITSLFGANIIGIHLVLYNNSPDGLAALLSPIFAFLPTLVPYFFAKRDEMRSDHG